MHHRWQGLGGVVLACACSVTPVDPDAFGDAGTGASASGVTIGADDEITTAVDDGGPGDAGTGMGSDPSLDDGAPDDGGPGDGPSDGPGDGPSDGPGDGSSDGPGDGPGDGSSEGSSDGPADPGDGAPVVCGDGIVDAPEDCDGALPAGAECFDAGYLGGGTLACGGDCSFDTSACNGPICGVPDAGAGACPPQCSSCAGGTCTFDCPGNIIDGGPCNGLTLECPPGWPCHVACGDEGCTDVTLECADGVCTVECAGIGACSGMNVACGIQQCAATCDIFSEPDLDCGGSCDCVAC